jgi:MFS family permease
MTVIYSFSAFAGTFAPIAPPRSSLRSPPPLSQFPHPSPPPLLPAQLTPRPAVSLGYTQTQSGLATTFLNIGTALGRPLIGITSDRLGRITTAYLLTLVNSLLAFAFWIPVTTLAPLLTLAVFYGGTCGVFWATIAPVCAEVVELGGLASLLCLQWLTVALPSLCE